MVKTCVGDGRAGINDARTNGCWIRVSNSAIRRIGKGTGMKTAEQWIDELELQPHPEGGFYREIYRSALASTPPEFSGERNACTHIYYLLTGDDRSRFHRIKSDELWHFYTGSALEVSIIHPANGRSETLSLSPNQPFGVVPAGSWFGASLPQNGYALVGCTVAPGFDFADFEMADREQLLSVYPQHKKTIERLT